MGSLRSGPLTHTVVLVAGARPNFPKIAPLYRAFSQNGPVRPVFVHTGQHYDFEMSTSFMGDLGLPAPDACLEVGSGSQAEQTAALLVRFERFLNEAGPVDMVVVVGDVNSSMGAALVAAKACVPVAHVEAGLRSWDRTMPEEVNRVVIDSLSALCLTHSQDADENLVREGHHPASVRRVGNLMIDSLVRALPARQPVDWLEEARPFALLTLHRPANVDEVHQLRALLEACLEVCRDRGVKLVYPVHPRVSARVQGLQLDTSVLRLAPPLPYLQFLTLLEACEFVLTDSGGIQEETSYLGIPCFTLRSNTERPITCTMGTNRLVGVNPSEIPQRVLADWPPTRRVPVSIPGWDGRAAERASQAILDFLSR